MTSAPGAAQVALAQVQRPLALFAQGISGRPMAVRSSSVSPVPMTQRVATTGAEEPDTILLPDVVDQFDSRKGNLRAYRVEVLRQAFAAETSCHEALGAALASAARPRLLRRFFRVVELLRVDTALLNLYPGAASDLRVLRRLALARRMPVRPVRRLPCLIDAMHRFSLGADLATLGAADHSGHLAGLLGAMARVQEPGAAQIDSLRVAQHICQVLDPQLYLRGTPRLEDAALPPSILGEVPGAVAHAPGWPDGPEPPDHAVTAPDNGLAQVGDFNALAARPGLQRHHGSSQNGHPTNGPADGQAPQPTRPHKPQTTTGACAHWFAPAAAQSYPIQGPYRFHDEWDYLVQRYRPAWCRVQEERLKGDDPQLLQQVRERHATVLQAVRRRFAAIRPETRQRLRGQYDGEELDLDRAILSRVERRAGHLGDGRLFTTPQKLQRDVSAAFLMDMSGSTGFHIPQTPGPGDVQAPEDDEPYFHAPTYRAVAAPKAPARRVIDLARDSLCLMCDALHGLGDRLAVYGFSGHNRHNVEFLVAKEFHEPWSSAAAMALSGMQPRGYTRTGAAIRHAITRLDREDSATRVLIVVTDGYPQDTDYGPDPASFEYGIHDTARALREATRAGIAAFCLSIDHAANDYLRRMCPPQQYLVVPDVNELPQQLVKVYRTLTSG